MRRYALPLAAAFLATAAVPSVASAANARVTVELNMRAGPSSSFPVVEVIPDDDRVTVHGCLGAYQWCDVTWQDARGWVYGDYLTYYYQNRYVPLVEYGSSADIPIIIFSVGSYWDNYYRDRPWYGHRSRWVSMWRGDERGIRDDGRGDKADRRENRAERGAAKVDGSSKNRAERRQLRDNRTERGGGGRDATTERSRENRTDRRGRSENRAERREGRDIAKPPGQENRAERGGQEGRRVRGEQGSVPKGGGGEVRERGSRPEGDSGGEQRGRGGREG